MRARIRNFALVPLLLVSTACRLWNPYACIYQTRFVGTSGTASVTGGGTVVVQYLNFREYTPEAQVESDMTWDVRGHDLAAPAVRLSLRDKRHTGRVVKALSLSGASATAFTAYSSMEIPKAERDQMLTLLNGNAIAVLELADGSWIGVPLTVIQREKWHRPNCG